MIYALYAPLGRNMWYTEAKEVVFDEEVWKKIVDLAVDAGINMIALDLGEGVRYGSHPELAHPGAWTRERVREEVVSLRERGIELIPKLNFSACHHLWLGEYRRMMGTKTYYNVCRDLITEVYYLFDKPRYIHLGMDEEGDPQFFKNFDIVSYRQGEMIWHDLQFLCDCVRDVGATPWIWGDLCLQFPEEFRKHVKEGSVLMSPWNYRALKPEHYTPIASQQKYIDYYSVAPYKYMNLTYVEEDPFCVRFMNEAVPAAKDGYPIVPCVSNCFGCEYNEDDTFDYFTENLKEGELAGFMMAPWGPITETLFPRYEEGFRRFKAAKEKYCK